MNKKLFITATVLLSLASSANMHALSFSALIPTIKTMSSWLYGATHTEIETIASKEKIEDNWVWIGENPEWKAKKEREKAARQLKKYRNAQRAHLNKEATIRREIVSLAIPFGYGRNRKAELVKKKKSPMQIWEMRLISREAQMAVRPSLPKAKRPSAKTIAHVSKKKKQTINDRMFALHKQKVAQSPKVQRAAFSTMCENDGLNPMTSSLFGDIDYTTMIDKKDAHRLISAAV